VSGWERVMWVGVGMAVVGWTVFLVVQLLLIAGVVH
jgi:hypothetical protein